VSTDSLLWLVLILILLEYNFRLRRSIGEKAEERFEKLKAEFLKKQAVKTPPKAGKEAAQPS